MEYFIYKDENELTHWGVRGMRWGVRRYQNKDGSLTPAGQKRLKAETEKLKKEETVLKNRKAVKAKLDKLASRKKAVEDEKKKFDDENKKSKHKKIKNVETEDTKKKSVKEMGDEELAYKIRRTQMEKQYEALTAEPETATKGNGFVKDFMTKAAVPAIQEAGKSLIRDSLLKAGKKYLGLEADVAVKTVDKLKEEYETLNYTDKINNLKNKAAKAAEKERAKAAEKEKTTTNKETKETKEENTVYEGTVSGVGTSFKSTREGRKWANNRTVYDVDFTEVTNNNNTSSGRSYVSNYLSLPAPRLGLPAPRDDD